MKFYNFLVIAITIFFCSDFAKATEPLCHTDYYNGICYYSDYEDLTCSDYGDAISLSGIVSEIHNSNILMPTYHLPENYPEEHYFQTYYTSENDTISRFTHLGYLQELNSMIPPPNSFNPDSLYGKVIRLKNFSKSSYSTSKFDSLSSDMMRKVDSNFIIVMWALPLQIGDTLEINGYWTGLNLMCSNISGSGAFDGEYTIYPASITTSLPNTPSSQQQKTPIRYYTVDGKLQAQKPEFVPVVEVKE